MGSGPIQIIGVPNDLGAGRRGVDMGPSAVRYANLADAIEALGPSCQDFGDLEVPLPELAATHSRVLRQLQGVLEVARSVRDAVGDALHHGYRPLVLGGDHSLSIGTLAGITEAWQSPGVLWVDAHADFNTPKTTPSGNIHGMALAAAFEDGPEPLQAPFEGGQFLNPSRVALVGVRSLDPGERERLRESGPAVFTMSEIDRHGLQAVMDEALRHVCAGTDGVHVSFDVDVLDPSAAPGVGTPVPGGLSYREAHLLMEQVAEAGLPQTLEVVEVNPILDERNRTGQLAVELIASALGRVIY